MVSPMPIMVPGGALRRDKRRPTRPVGTRDRRPTTDDRRPTTDDRRPAAELVEAKGRRSAHSKEATLCGVASLRGLHYGVSEESQRRSVLQRLAPNKRCGHPHDNRCGLTLFHGSVNVMSAFRESAYGKGKSRRVSSCNSSRRWIRWAMPACNQSTAGRRAPL